MFEWPVWFIWPVGSLLPFRLGGPPRPAGSLGPFRSVGSLVPFRLVGSPGRLSPVGSLGPFGI